MKNIILGLASASLCALTPILAFAGPYEDGVAAYDAENYEQAYRLLKPLAGKHDGAAEYYLGVMYEYGNGIVQSDKQAIHWYKRSAEHGDPDGQYELGLAYYLGSTGVRESDKKAAKWFQKAADQGHIRASSKLGLLYKLGDGVKQNTVKAVRLYTIAADNDDVEATAYLAALYENGDGVDKDYGRAVKMYKKAALAGND